MGLLYKKVGEWKQKKRFVSRKDKKSYDVMESKLLSHEEYKSMVDELGDKIKKDFQPDVIIPIARGGLPIARDLADGLGVKETPSIEAKHDVFQNRNAEVHLEKRSELDLKEKKVLLVDDIHDTGETLREAVKYLTKEKKAEVRTATLHLREGSKGKPDYYSKKAGKGVWVVYPWEIHEDVSLFIHDILKEGPLRTSEIRKRLKKKWRVKGSKEAFKKRLDRLEKVGELEKISEKGKTLWKRKHRKLERW